jgi:hypothetical protein
MKEQSLPETELLQWFFCMLVQFRKMYGKSGGVWKWNSKDIFLRSYYKCKQYELRSTYLNQTDISQK